MIGVNKILLHRKHKLVFFSWMFEIWEVGGELNNRRFEFTETIPGVYSSKQARNELLSYIKKQGYHFSNPSDEARIRNGNLEDITDVDGEYIYIEK